MYIRRTTRHVKGKTYHNHLLVESVATPNGPRQRVICSLGALAPAPKTTWLGLAQSFTPPSPVKPRSSRTPPSTPWRHGCGPRGARRTAPPTGRARR